MTTDLLPSVPDDRSLSERVDRATGRIRASGYLTPQGADLLSGTADSLRGSGHVRVVIDLSGIRSADADALALLHDLPERFAVDGGELLFEHFPPAS